MNLTQIDKGIRDLRGIVKNVNERVQTLAVAIVIHTKEHGDCSRALALVQALPQSFRRDYLIRWFEYFGSIGMNVKEQKVNLIDKASKRYRGFDVDGAKANDWSQPFDASGKKADWYQGPAPAVFEPNTLGNLGQNLINFSDRFLGTDRKAGELFATKDNGLGKQVPIYDLSDEETKQATTALEGMKKIGLMLMARERAEVLTNEVVQLNEYVAETGKVLDTIGKLGNKQTDEDEAIVEQAVNG